MPHSDSNQCTRRHTDKVVRSAPQRRCCTRATRSLLTRTPRRTLRLFVQVAADDLDAVQRLRARVTDAASERAQRACLHDDAIGRLLRKTGDCGNRRRRQSERRVSQLLGQTLQVTNCTAAGSNSAHLRWRHSSGLHPARA